MRSLVATINGATAFIVPFDCDVVAVSTGGEDLLVSTDPDLRFASVHTVGFSSFNLIAHIEGTRAPMVGLKYPLKSGDKLYVDVSGEVTIMILLNERGS